MATFKVFIFYLVFLYMPIKLSTPLSTVKFKECFFTVFAKDFPLFWRLEQIGISSTLRCCGQTACKKSQDCNESCNGIIYSKVLDAKSIQHHSAGVERHQHQYKHPDIKHQGVFHDALVV